MVRGEWRRSVMRCESAKVRKCGAKMRKCESAKALRSRLGTGNASHGGGGELAAGVLLQGRTVVAPPDGHSTPSAGASTSVEGSDGAVILQPSARTASTMVCT